MTHLLFIDACPRGAGVSRSLALGEAFLQALLRLRPDTEVVRHTLNDLRLAALDGEALARREALIEARAWEDAMFAQARAFAEADEIVVAAPYWDLMFPAALKVYIEHIFVREMTFVYRDDRPVGCAARAGRRFSPRRAARWARRRSAWRICARRCPCWACGALTAWRPKGWTL